MTESQANLYLNYNGEIVAADARLLTANNRSFRYGDGCFETMKLIDNNILFEDLHWQRLLSSLPILRFTIPSFFTPGFIKKQIQLVAEKNKHTALARIRLTVFRGDGSLYDTGKNEPEFMIQSWALPQFPRYAEKGLTIDIYHEARKTADAFSHIKSNNYLPYAMAALWCRKMGLDDALLLNAQNRIVEGSIANVFIVKKNVVSTPPLSEGCIAGVVRRYLLQAMKNEQMPHQEKELSIDDVMDADEVFFTNAGWHIQWVQQCGGKTFGNHCSKRLYNQFILPLLK